MNKSKPRQENHYAAWKDQSMFTTTLKEVFKECEKCTIGGDGHICIVEGCPERGIIDENKYEQWKKEKRIWDENLRLASIKDNILEEE